MSQKPDRPQIIKPRVLKGFRDSLPMAEIPKKAIIDRLEALFSSYGFVPIDTPVLEYMEVLLGKGGGETDKQIFHFVDNGGREVAMRFDLTVPFARFLAQHRRQLPMPFKRFHVNKVWRGENPQKGRYREFIQCDFDIVGLDSAEADFEILSVMYDSFKEIGVKNYRFHLAHRGLFNQMLTHLQISEHTAEILRSVDKLRKIGREAVQRELLELIGSNEKADAILTFIEKEEEQESFTTTLDRLERLGGGVSEYSERMRTIYSYLQAAGIASAFTLDPSITRGLDYYTGLVDETFLTDLPHYGSVCSGGRYNELASLYTREQIPGVGSSIGLDRLMSALEELDSPITEAGASATVAVFATDYQSFAAREAAARALRKEGLAVSLYLDTKKLGNQYKWAEAQAIPFVLIPEETNFTLKHLTTAEQWDHVTIAEVIAIITKETH